MSDSLKGVTYSYYGSHLGRITANPNDLVPLAKYFFQVMQCFQGGLARPDCAFQGTSTAFEFFPFEVMQ